jgi:N-acetylglucosamine kinase-like BadF-type ATPase
MILVADSGSTKTEWKIINGEIPEDSIFSSGINPYFLTQEEIFHLLKNELGNLYGSSFKKIYFYGSGCNSDIKNNIIKESLTRFFAADEIFIGTDLLGAARSLCQNEPGIACIIGTGSNSCYYDGSVIAANVSPLGYILGDEGGGAVLGRKLVGGVLKKQVSRTVINHFFDTYKLTPAEILENVYMKPFPNRFLGQFAKFLLINIDIPELQYIITSSFDDFIKMNILQYPESKKLPIHFTGSIAYNFQSFLVDLLLKHDLEPGIITQSPMENLISYHLTNK